MRIRVKGDSMLINQHEATAIWPTKDAASDLLETLRAEDPDWTYYIRPFANGFSIAIEDEDGNHIGFIG